MQLEINYNPKKIINKNKEFVNYSNYGITDLDLQVSRNKLKVQNKYLNDTVFTTSSGQVKSYMDVSFSANHSQRYYSELINKINTIETIVLTKDDYIPIFMTMTLDGFYRDFLKGNFDRYDSKYDNFIPNNEKYGLLRDKIKHKEKFSINELYKCISHQLNRFQSSYIYRKMFKDGNKPLYVRCCEPHKKDGVPHLHMLMYIHKDYKDEVQKAFNKYFPAPQNLKKLNSSGDGQTNGFQWIINNPTGYVLKYIFKSFRNVKSGEDIDKLQSWYIKNRILRVVTSHSLVPAWVYRKMYALDSDWFYLTELISNGLCEWSKDDDYIQISNYKGTSYSYNKGIYKYYHTDSLIKEFGIKKEKKDTSFKINNNNFEQNFKKQKVNKCLNVIIDNVHKLNYNVDKKKYYELPKIPSLMSYIELFNYIKELKKDDIMNMDKLYIANKEMSYFANTIKS